MAAYFCDSSAIVKRYMTETGSHRMELMIARKIYLKVIGSIKAFIKILM